MESTDRSLSSKRLEALPVYLFEDLVAKRIAKESQGYEIIDLSIGNPDLGAPAVAVECLKRHASDSSLHGYTPERVIRHFSEQASAWMVRRFGVRLDPDHEVFPVIGTKEGLGHLPLAIVDPNDAVLVPDPAYPVYASSVALAGGRSVTMPLIAGNSYLPVLEDFKCEQPKLIFLNYPNNPTSAIAAEDFFSQAIEFARTAGAIVVNDAAYSEIVFDGYVSPSILSVDGATEVAVEFHSFSKTFSMAGWRIGFIAGSREVIKALSKLKSNLDSGVFAPILLAASAVIESGWDDYIVMLEEYARRRRMLVESLRLCGLTYHESPATLYIWVKTPGNYSSLEFAELLLEAAGLLVAPGRGFGRFGEGYFRISLTCPTEKVEIACKQLCEVSELWQK